MVPPAGIEPALPKERDFESRASTSSARGATGTELRLYHGLTPVRKNDCAHCHQDLLQTDENIG